MGGAAKPIIPIGLIGLIGLIDYLYLPLSHIKTYYSYRFNRLPLFITITN